MRGGFLQVFFDSNPVIEPLQSVFLVVRLWEGHFTS